MIWIRIILGGALLVIGRVTSFLNVRSARITGRKLAEGEAAKKGMERVEDVNRKVSDPDFVKRVRDKYRRD